MMDPAIPRDATRGADQSATPPIRLGQIAYARSGDKGSSANVGVIAHTPTGFRILQAQLSAALVKEYFAPLGVGGVVRYELANLGALNFVLAGILPGGGTGSLRVDAQGKALGQAILEMCVEVPEQLLPDCLLSGKE